MATAPHRRLGPCLLSLKRPDLRVDRELRCSEAQLTAPAALSTLSFKQLVIFCPFTSMDGSLSCLSVAELESVLLSLSSLGLALLIASRGRDDSCWGWVDAAF